jgi:hypothetical protein
MSLYESALDQRQSSTHGGTSAASDETRVLAPDLRANAGHRLQHLQSLTRKEDNVTSEDPLPRCVRTATSLSHLLQVSCMSFVVVARSRFP